MSASATTVNSAMTHGKLLTAQFRLVVSPQVLTSARPQD
jgi:hypothetical protein